MRWPGRVLVVKVVVLGRVCGAAAVVSGDVVMEVDAFDAP